jgi:hypothetical protein
MPGQIMASVINSVTRYSTENYGTDFSIYFTEPEEQRQAYIQIFEQSFVSDCSFDV